MKFFPIAPFIILEVENHINHGGKYLSLSGNTCWWQIRIEDNDSTLVCYKYPQTDPLYGKVDSLLTVNWFDKPLNLPENLLLGASFRNAGYVDDINHKDFTHAQGYGGFSAHNTQHWIFNNTGLKDGEIFGRDPKDSLSSIVGYETDGRISSGIYFYSVEASSLNGKEHFRAAKKIILLK